MVSTDHKELIVIRSLADSDLGLFEAQRGRVRSKQRAVNINAVIARQMLDAERFAAGEVSVDCALVYRGRIVNGPRPLRKVHKNWRLGGNRVTGKEFAHLRPGDFLIMRCRAENDGSKPVWISLVSLAEEPVDHRGVSLIIKDRLQDGMAVFDQDVPEFRDFLHLCPREMIAVRSLAESDLGVFATLRKQLSSKQRAFNINAAIARQMMSPARFGAGGGKFFCTCRFTARPSDGWRPLTKVHKNWRLGGDNFPGAEFAEIGCKDFLLIRSVEWNDGRYPFALTFISKRRARVVHAGIADSVALTASMASLTYGHPLFDRIAKYCPHHPHTRKP
jgi:hypothetical protein